MSFSIGSLTVDSEEHVHRKCSMFSSDCLQRTQVGSTSLLLNLCLLACRTYDPHRNFNFEGSLVLSFTDWVSNCRRGCIFPGVYSSQFIKHNFS